MKNFKPSMSFIASLALAAIVVVPVFAAGPNQAPPANLVDAKFNSVTAVGNLSGATVTADGSLKGATVQATGTGYFAQGVSGGTIGQNATGGHFSGTDYGVTADALGNSGIGGDFTGNLEGVHANTQNNGIAGVFVNLGDELNPNSTINTRVSLAGNVKAIDATGDVNVIGQLLDTANCLTCFAGRFISKSGTNTVNLGTNTYSIDAQGPVNVAGNTTISGVVNMNSLNVDALGQISNTSGNVKINDNLDIIGQILSSTGAVTVNDADGFAITNGATKNMTIVPNGNLTTVSTAGNLDFNLANGTGTLYVEGGPGIGPILSVNKYGIYNPGFPPQPLNIIDHEGLAVADENGNVGLNFSSFGEGFISSPSGNVTVSSHLKANSIGSFYTTPYATNIVGTTISKTCPTGKLVSCFVNGLAAGNTIKSLTSSGEGCFLSTTATSINVAARCFDSAL